MLKHGIRKFCADVIIEKEKIKEVKLTKKEKEEIIKSEYVTYTINSFEKTEDYNIKVPLNYLATKYGSKEEI